MGDMPTMDTDTDIMARGPLMPSQLPLPSPRLLLMLTTDMVVMDIWDMVTMDTDMPPGMDMDMDMVMDTDMDMDTDMPTTVIPDTHMPTVPMDVDMVVKFF